MRSDHFDVIIVGSGFGGSVMASRLAEADMTVCVLERGKPYPPNSFPRSPWGMSRNMWDPSEGRHGMFDLWAFQGLDALVASGLGGGSLIYANVILRKDEKWFVKEEPGAEGYEHWPITRAQLDPHYDRVEQVLGVQKYPLEQDPYSSTRKTLAFKEAAERLGQNWFLPNLAVTFANPGEPARLGEPIVEPAPNLHGRTRTTCRLCGECDVGCQYGSKNTLDYTYLTRASQAGTDIRTLTEVRSFEPREGGGYAVHYVVHDPDAEGPVNTAALEPQTLTCDRLVLSAGTLGSTFLMLRNRAAFPGLSPALGTHFSGNGDLLTFMLKATQEGPDGKRVPRVLDAARGPVITSAIRVPDELDGGGAEGRGFYLEDAGYPQFVSWMLQMADTPSALLRAAPIVRDMIRERLGGYHDPHLGDEVERLLDDAELASGVLPLLGMGRDIPDGNMALDERGRLSVDWRKHGRSKEYFDRVRRLSRDVAEQLGAEFLDNPIWHFNRVITVHSLGGCPMGESRERGVVDPETGQVWGYDGLHIADGSVMPGPVGANPSATIAAVADRFADAIVEGRSPIAPRPASPPPPPPPPAGEGRSATAVSLAFTEEMKGFFTFDETDFERGFREGKRHRRGLMFHLTITADDIDRFIADPLHDAKATGYVKSDALGGELPVELGLFNLFVDQAGDKSRKRMYYRLRFADGEGHPLTLTGFKVVEDDPGFDAWSDTTTLYTTLLAGHVDAGGDATATLVGRGILHIPARDFIKQMTTFRTDPPHHLEAVARFGALFAGDLWEVYSGLARKDETPG